MCAHICTARWAQWAACLQAVPFPDTDFRWLEHTRVLLCDDLFCVTKVSGVSDVKLFLYHFWIVQSKLTPSAFFFFPPFICYGLWSSSEPSCSLPKRQAQALHELRLGIGWILHCGASAQGDFIFLCKHSLKISASHLSFWLLFPPCMASRTAQGEWLCSWWVRDECLRRPFSFASRMGGCDTLQRLLSWALSLTAEEDFSASGGTGDYLPFPFNVSAQN